MAPFVVVRSVVGLLTASGPKPAAGSLGSKWSAERLIETSRSITSVAMIAIGARGFSTCGIECGWHGTCDCMRAEIVRARQSEGGHIMPRGDKSRYTDKQKRQAEHVEEGYEKRGVPEQEAARRAWATVNKVHGGGRKSGSGKGKSEDHAPMKKGGRKGGAAAGARSAAARSASARTAARTRARKQSQG
jgi:hypothetical protein